MQKTSWLFLLFILFIHTSQVIAANCKSSDLWFSPANNQVLEQKNVLESLPNSGIVLLGEHHANSAHHVWQLRMIKQLYKKQKSFAIGLEMQPRSHQDVLDQWIANKLDKKTFLAKSKWFEYWGSNFEDYFPILDYARSNQIPLIALNVSHELLLGIKQVGWSNVPVNHREGVGDPSTPGKNYVMKLAKSFSKHQPKDKPLDKQAFQHFYEQQLIWDRSMAERLSEAVSKSSIKLVVGMMGSWHMIDKEGVPYQLEKLGHPIVTTLVPWDNNFGCEDVTPSFADFVFGLVRK